MKKLHYITRHFKKHWFRNSLFLVLSFFAILGGAVFIWATTIEIPDLNSFESRRIAQSTKILDRTGEILLYDIHANAKRTLVTFENISENIKKATIAIEDTNFYNHKGVRLSSFIRAAIANLTSAGFSQGGSTITQQVIKNTVLTTDKTITRKLKEIILALKLEKVLTKDQILTTYLNETPYGGNIYGVEEASRQFFSKSAKDVNLAEAAYLAALPQAPTYYSPFGKNKSALDERQKLVLRRMFETGVIKKEEYDQAKGEVVKFQTKSEGNIRAPHFSMMVRDYLIDKYSEEVVMNSGLKVITTLDYDMQEKAEGVVKNFSKSLEENFNASNTAMVGLDPKTGDILMMVGSKDYFDESIDGNVNIATALRQPGSTFKPFVYAAAWEKGFTPKTILFDVATEFSSECTPEGKPKDKKADQKDLCYSPINYDEIFEGPLTMEKALAQSRNIPAVKTLYLVGINNALKLAKRAGITTFNDPDRYGLTLVLGGGEVSLLELTNAYGVFANEGERVARRFILKVEDSNGKVLEENTDVYKEKVLTENVAKQISSALSNKKIRLDSLNSLLSGVSQPIAVKTGTTNDYRDVWIVGYTPNVVVGAWAGKNDNTPMERKVAGVIISPVWAAFMAEYLKDKPVTSFKQPDDISDYKTKPVLRGIWQGGISYFLDKVSKKLATEYTPEKAMQENVFNNVHSILHWINKDDPNGKAPENPADDSQYENWEYGVRKWFDTYKKDHPEFVEADKYDIPKVLDDVHTPEKMPKANIVLEGDKNEFRKNEELSIKISGSFPYPVTKIEFLLNNVSIGIIRDTSQNFVFTPSSSPSIQEDNELSAVIYDSVFNTIKTSVSLKMIND